MSCLKCPLVTLAEMRPDLAAFDAATGLLCPEHFREFAAAKQLLVARRMREVSRIFCPAFCGTEMYLARPGVCERCRVGPQEVADPRLVPAPKLRRVAPGAE